MSIEIEKKVSEILQNAGIEYRAANRGLKQNALNGKHEMDAWKCTFSKPGYSEDFDFYTGSGLRHAATANDKQHAAGFFPGLTENDKKGLTSYGKRFLQKVEDLRKPKPPCAASVLHSLILDSSAACQSFDSWCSEFGKDSDSRTAYKTHEACQQNADKLSRVIPQAVQSALTEALQDY